ncbi:hypothetical protein AKO1_010508 [Acrasis kona]|uniref:DUF2415 domain-containing protein n=1 Tax=Acrasis kona TaxID=1008807 RepID=A0AAW2ZL40_9EUKA
MIATPALKTARSSCNTGGEDPAYNLKFIFEPPVQTHKKRTTVQHWQLRDLIHCSDENPYEVFHANKEKIYKFNVKTLQTVLVQHLDYAAASFSARYGYLATGGHNAQLTVKNLNTDCTMANTSIGHNINNACNISRHKSGEHLLLMANNDRNIKIFSMQALEDSSTVSPLFDITHSVAVNYTCVSPDGNYMACVADNSFVTLYEMKDVRTFVQVARMSEYRDGGFSCCFNTNSLHLAAASQDGTVVVWDIRKVQTPLAKFKSKQKSNKGAVRCVKYSCTSSVDLLAFAEHETYVHVVDARTYQDEQIVSVTEENGVDRISVFADSSLSSARDISGLSFSSNSSSLFVGTEEHLKEFKVDLMSRRIFVQGDLI